ncbi:MAG TPA: ATP-binding protein, partial [Bryobacteraceae bacterium]|nr:ATP-binding protein [Bryobacteraceae bacterium]
LFESRHVTAAATLAGVAVLSRIEWNAANHVAIFIWAAAMSLIVVARLVLASRYQAASPDPAHAPFWGALFTVGSGLAGLGWGSAAIVFNSTSDLPHQTFLLFILGGMMLGGVSLLASWRPAVLAFLLPTGLLPASRLLLAGAEAPVAMALMTALFTAALAFTALRIHHAIANSIAIQFENAHLVEDLRAANSAADDLNQRLEARVEERTAELRESTEKLRAEMAQRQQVEEALVRASKLESLGVMAGGIAHDFNNFLTIVQGNLEMARLQLDPAHPVQVIFLETASACRRAALLSSQLLTFAKGGAPIRRLCSLRKLIEDAVLLVRLGARSAIQLHVADDLYAAEVDPAQLVQVLHCILVNAIQATTDASPVEIHAVNAAPLDADDPVRALISIRDHGCGIPKDILPRIFDPYFSTKSGSSGLGLATAYAIVAKHGGSITVESTPGEGSTFTVELPASLRQPQPLLPPPPNAARIETGAGRLLVMDDEDALRLLLKAALTKLGYDVQAARDGAEAISLCESALAQGLRFHAALLDLTVQGGMGGLDASVRLRELDPDIKLIVSSGYSD